MLSQYNAFQFPLDGVKLDLDEAILKGRTKDLIGYLHEKLKHVSMIFFCKFQFLVHG